MLLYCFIQNQSSCIPNVAAECCFVLNLEEAIDYILASFKFGVWTSGGWHRRAGTRSSGEIPYFSCMFVTCASSGFVNECDEICWEWINSK